MSRLIDKLKQAERSMRAPRPETEELREKIETERGAEQTQQARIIEEKRGLDLARERQQAEAELRRIAHARAEAETKAGRLIADRERAEAHALSEARARGQAGRGATEISAFRVTVTPTTTMTNMAADGM